MFCSFHQTNWCIFQCPAGYWCIFPLSLWSLEEPEHLRAGTCFSTAWMSIFFGFDASCGPQKSKRHGSPKWQLADEQIWWVQSRMHPQHQKHESIHLNISQCQMFKENVSTCPIFLWLSVSNILSWFPRCFLHVATVVSHIFPISKVFSKLFPLCSYHIPSFSKVVPWFFPMLPWIFPWFSHGFPQAVVWYAGATASQIERSIAKAAGFGEAPIECRDGEDVAPWSSKICGGICRYKLL